MYMYNWINAAIPLKLTQHWKSTILQYKIKSFLKSQPAVDTTQMSIHWSIEKNVV